MENKCESCDYFELVKPESPSDPAMGYCRKDCPTANKDPNKQALPVLVSINAGCGEHKHTG